MTNNRVDRRQKVLTSSGRLTKFNGCSREPKNDNENEKESICSENCTHKQSSLSQVVNQEQIERLDEENGDIERVKKAIGDKQGQSLGKNFRRKKQRIRNSTLIVIFSRLPMFKTWLTFFQILLIQSAQLLEIKCDQLTGNDLIPPGQSINSIDVMQDIEDQLQAQLKQQRSFDYMVQQQQQQQEPDNKNNQQQQQQQQQEQQQKEQNQPSLDQQEQVSFNQVINNLRATIGDENWVRDIAGNQEENQTHNSHSQQFSIEDLLEPQSSASSAANTSPTDSTKQPSKSTQETQHSSTGSSSNPNEAKPTSSTSSSPNSAASPASNLLSDQLNTVSHLLQQLSQQGQSTFSSALQSSLIDQNALSDAIINGVSNSILGPIRSQTSAVSNIVRKTMNSNRNQAQQQQQPSSSDIQTVSAAGSNKPATVGQSIDGNIEYDSNNNAINGFIDFPSIPGLGNGSKPSLSSIKPLFVTALKTVPIKLGTVGWKLLQLIAWKKIYKTHHPKSGEIVIEQEIGHSKDQKKSTGGKSFDIEMPAKHVKTSKMGKSYQHSSGYSRGGGGGHMMMTPVTMGHMMPSSWHYGPMDGSPHMSGSMVYQRHLLPPPYHPNGGQMGPSPATTNSHHSHQSNTGIATNSHPATAAAAAAAATAAAIQSQWVQHQLVAANDEIGATAAALAGTEAVSSQSAQPVASNGATASNARNQTAPHAPQSNALSRKRSSLASTGNWFATPAHAYAAAAAAAAANAAATAAAASHHHHHHHQNPLYRFGLSSAFGPNSNYNNLNSNNNPVLDPTTGAHSHDNGFNHALATNMLYQNLFDNAAAMAVQNTVKLPPTNPLQMDYLDQSDSLSGSSLSLGGGAGMSPTTSDSEVAWSSGIPDEAAPGLSASVAQRSGLLAPSSMDRSSSSAAAEAAAAAAADLINGLGNDGLMALTHDPDHPNTATNALMSVPDFDDTPSSKYIGPALNETDTTYSDLSPRFDGHKS